MKVCVVGGGSTYTPELVEGLLSRREELGLREIHLVDVDAGLGEQADDRQHDVVGALPLGHGEAQAVAALALPLEAPIATDFDAPADVDDAGVSGDLVPGGR